jgi:hypothetical protein
LSYQASIAPNFVGPEDTWVHVEFWGKCGFQVNWSVGRKLEMSQCRYGPVPTGAWIRIETQVTMNKVVESHDGIIRLWVNGTMAFQDTTARLSDPTYEGVPTWRIWAVGQDRQSADAMDFAPDLSDGPWFDEIRYWDNVAFTTTRLPSARSRVDSSRQEAH